MTETPTTSSTAPSAKTERPRARAVIDRLEALKFVRRDQHPNDRRKVVVVLDEAKVGERLAPFYVEQGAALEQIVAALSPSEQQTVARFLRSLIETRD